MKSSAKTCQLFRVIMLLSRGRYIAVKELAEELDIDTRTTYRYVEDIKNSPFFKIEQRGKGIRIARNSLLWTSALNNMFLTDGEARALNTYLEHLDTEDPILRGLKQKVRTIVDNYVAPLANDADTRLTGNVANIQTAIDKRRLCILRGYTSLHSGTKTDRLVEPFLFLGNTNDIRCYEVASQQNKTFKVSRCDKVEVLDVGWQFEHRHRQMYTDIFHFADETKTRVRLLLGNLSKTLLLEEHPEAERYLIPHHDGRWMLDAEYCSMKGIGRFYLGLFEDIEIVDSPEFSAYLSSCLQTLLQKEGHRDTLL